MSGTLPVSFEDIEAARKRIAGGTLVSPCPESKPLSGLCSARIFCKLEYLQRTGSFKERGARNALLLLAPEARARGVIAASAGNHALGLAYHGRMLDVPVTVVMPSFAPLIKVTTCRNLGARVVQHGTVFQEAKDHADKMAADEGLTYIHGYDDPAIIAGQGTIGLEILEQVPDVEAVVVPIGGGGLIAGVALALKTLKPRVKVIGVEPKAATCYTAALKVGRPTPVEVRPTLADGLAVSRVGANAFAIARDHVDRIVRVGEDELALAILRLVELEKSVVEGAGAAPLAAFLGDKIPEMAERTVVLLLSGGNIDPTVLSRVIECGLVADGRLIRFTATISDRPGGLARLASLIAATGASIKDITHDRAFAGPDISAVNVLCTLETRDRDHIAEIHRALEREGIRFTTRSDGA